MKKSVFFVAFVFAVLFTFGQSPIKGKRHTLNIHKTPANMVEMQMDKPASGGNIAEPLLMQKPAWSATNIMNLRKSPVTMEEMPVDALAMGGNMEEPQPLNYSGFVQGEKVQYIQMKANTTNSTSHN